MGPAGRPGYRDDPAPGTGVRPRSDDRPGIFDPRSVDDQEDAVVGRVWGIRVVYDVTVPLGRCVVTANHPQQYPWVTFDFELGPPLRVHVEPVDPLLMAERARVFREKLQDLRDHVALEQHRSLALEPGGHATPDGFLALWTVSCCVDPKLCRRQWAFSEDEIAAAGRPDLMDHFGWGHEIEQAKLTGPRERPIAWQKVGTLLADEYKAMLTLGGIFQHLSRVRHRDIKGWLALMEGQDDWRFRCQGCGQEWTIRGSDVRQEPQLRGFKTLDGPQQVIAIMLKTPTAQMARPNAWEKLQDGFLDDDP